MFQKKILILLCTLFIFSHASIGSQKLCWIEYQAHFPPDTPSSGAAAPQKTDTAVFKYSTNDLEWKKAREALGNELKDTSLFFKRMALKHPLQITKAIKRIGQGADGDVFLIETPKGQRAIKLFFGKIKDTINGVIIQDHLANLNERKLITGTPLMPQVQSLLTPEDPSFDLIVKKLFPFFSMKTVWGVPRQPSYGIMMDYLPDTWAMKEVIDPVISENWRYPPEAASWDYSNLRARLNQLEEALRQMNILPIDAQVLITRSTGVLHLIDTTHFIQEDPTSVWRGTEPETRKPVLTHPRSVIEYLATGGRGTSPGPLYLRSDRTPEPGDYAYIHGQAVLFIIVRPNGTIVVELINPKTLRPTENGLMNVSNKDELDDRAPDDLSMRIHIPH